MPLYFTLQPGGAYVKVSGINVPPGARIIYPNRFGYPSGTRMAFWHYDPSGRGWYVYGQGAVAGAQIVPDPGVSIYEFTGAMVARPEIAPDEGPPVKGEKDQDPVDLFTGLFVYEKTDLALTDIMPIALRRTYRPRDARSRAFGVGTTHDYELYLVGAFRPWVWMDLVLPDGGRVHYDRISPGSSFEDGVFEHTATPSRFYKSRITWDSSTTTWALRLKDGTTYRFPDSENLSDPARAGLRAIRDRHGNNIVLTRDSAGRLTQITSPNGRWIRLTYDAVNRISPAEDNIGRAVVYTYDAVGRLWKVTDPASGVTEFTYDAEHRMRTIKDPRGIVYLTNDYDTAGRVIKQTQADGTFWQAAYTLGPNGAVVQTDVTNPRGSVRRVTFNAAGYVLTDTRAVGTPEAQTTTYVRQAGSNLPLSITDALNRKTTYAYDASGNVTSVTRLADTPDAVTTTFTYEPLFHQVATVTDPLNHTTSFTYDALGNMTKVTDPLGQATTVTLNPAGQPATVSDALNQTTQFGYQSGDLASTTTPLGAVTTRSVDGAGRVLNVTDPLGQQTTFEYSLLDQITRVTDALNGETVLTYDPNGNLLTLTDARTNTTTWTYNSMDRVETRTDPLTRVERYAYDANGNVAQVTDRKNQMTTYTYDPLDRPRVVTYADSSTTTHTYDAGDRLAEIADSAGGTITRTHDGLDRLMSETTPEGTVSYTYDLGGRRATMSVTGQQQIAYGYDDANRLSSITQGTSVVSFAYDAASRRTSLTLPNGIVTEYGYDAASRLSALAYKLSGTTIGDLTYTSDASGHRVTVGGSWARTGLPSALSSASYDAGNRLVNWGAATSTSDENGNVIADGTHTLNWNSRNQLTGISGGSMASFVYDGTGRRRSRTVNSANTAFLYDGLNPGQELTATVPTANLLGGLTLDELFARADSAGTRHVSTDVLGSVVALTDDAGTVQTGYTYEPFGQTSTVGSTTSNTIAFTGRELDGTGFQYYRARYYSSTLHRFLQEDPLGFLAGFNLFTYVNNEPTRYTDPLGLERKKSEIPSPEGEGLWAD